MKAGEAEDQRPGGSCVCVHSHAAARLYKSVSWGAQDSVHRLECGTPVWEKAGAVRVLARTVKLKNEIKESRLERKKGNHLGLQMIGSCS